MRTHRVARSHACESQFWGLREKRQLGLVGKSDRESPLAERPSCGKQMAIGPSSHSGPLSCLWRAHSRLLPASPGGRFAWQNLAAGQARAMRGPRLQRSRPSLSSFSETAGRSHLVLHVARTLLSFRIEIWTRIAGEVVRNITPWRTQPQAQSQG